MNSKDQESFAVSVVVPIFNEAENIALLVDTLIRVFQEQELRWEGVFIDDGSSDESWEELELLVKKYRNLTILRFTRNFGKEAAIYAGLIHAQAPVTLVMDSDLQHPPELIKQMWHKWEEGAVDVVSAVKTKRQKESLSRSLGAKLFYWVFRKAARIDLEASTDFKLISTRVRETYLALPEKQRFFRGLTNWFGFPETTVAFVPPQRQSVEPSKWKIRSLYQYALSSLVSFSSLPIRVMGWLGAGTLVFAVILGIQTLYMKFSGQAVVGFTTVVLVLLFIGSILMIGLAIIGAYVSEIYHQVRERPAFIIQEARLREDHRQKVY